MCVCSMGARKERENLQFLSLLLHPAVARQLFSVPSLVVSWHSWLKLPLKDETACWTQLLAHAGNWADADEAMEATAARTCTDLMAS
jgi:hypothetical protein